MGALAQEMAVNPRNMLQKLAETALELCSAETAGVSLLETQDDQEVFRWEALAGVCAKFRRKPRPCRALPVPVDFGLMKMPRMCGLLEVLPKTVIPCLRPGMRIMCRTIN